MARFAFRFRIAPGSEQEYARRHADVWPAMLSALHDAGYRNYSIYRDGIDLFGYFEADDPVVTMRAIANSPVAQGWERMMSDILDRGVGGRIPALTEVFHLD